MVSMDGTVRSGVSKLFGVEGRMSPDKLAAGRIGFTY